MNVGYVVDDIKECLKGVYEFNKMSEGKQFSMLDGTLIKEIDIAHKVYVERAEINRIYVYTPSIAEQQEYTLDPLTLKIFSVDYIINTDIYSMKKIFPDDKNVAETIGNDGIVPSFYDDFTEPTKLKVFPTADVTGASFQIYYQKQIATVTELTEDLLIPDRCYDDFRDYLINRQLIMHGYMAAERVNMLDQLGKVKAMFLNSAEAYRRYKAFDNPDTQGVADGSM